MGGSIKTPHAQGRLWLGLNPHPLSGKMGVFTEWNQTQDNKTETRITKAWQKTKDWCAEVGTD